MTAFGMKPMTDLHDDANLLALESEVAADPDGFLLRTDPLTDEDLILIGSLVGLAMCVLGRNLLGIDGTVLLAISLLAGLIATGFIISRCLNSLSTSLTITSSRSILHRGILSSSTSEVQHDDIRNIRADRSTIERLLNYGDIAISSSGQDDFEIVVHDIPDPEGVLKIIRSNQSSHR